MATQAEIEIPGIPATLKITPPGVQPASVPNPKKKLVRRTGHDYSQLTRRIFQIAFLVLNGWLGVIFYIWVRQFEPGGASTSMPRPAGVEGWLPIAGLMNLKYLLLTRHVPTLHPAALFLLIAFLAISFLFRKAFCSWLCPVGTISEYLWRIGRKFFRRNFQAPRWLDLALRSLKYLLLAFFFVAAFSMGADEISAFMASPYGLIADVRMLNFFRDLGETAATVLTVLAIASLFIQNFWCRYLCPYGALLGLAALASPTRIRRNAASCIDCAKCAKACPSSLPVDKLITIKSAECTGCLECVAVCPAKDTLSLSLPKLPGLAPPQVPVWAMAAGITILFFGIVGFAKTSGYWDSQVPRAIYQQLVPQADQAQHPMPGEDK
ncbi:MAG: 4Fe-4S binding protein [Terriglobales bacterium]